MKAQFSFGLAVQAVHVTERDIQLGEARSCSNCAIARALNRQLPLFGFQECHVRLTPYGAFTTPDGLEIEDWRHNTVATLKPEHLPKGLVEWAMDFDEWSEFVEEGSDKRAWQKKSGGEPGEYPFKPEPVSFVFNFGNLIYA